MELTIEQALQQGVAAHNSGNLQEAERVYQAILRSQPKHPDASHNLGLITISVNQIEAALPLFKTALDVNPTIEQFWLSYIDALVKNNQLKDAKQAIKKAKKKGFNAKKLETLLSQSKVKADTKEPSQEQLSSLMEHYQNGRFGDAEELAISITEQFPKHQLSWKVLGAIFGQTGRQSESVNANRKAVALSPQDAEAHSNLGNTLKELGRLDEAEASYRQAIALKPDFAEAHYNFGNTLQELGRLDEAEASYTEAIALSPQDAEAHSNLGNTLKELGRLDEAEASYRQAIALKPDFAITHSNLGVTLKELGRLDEAEASYTQAIALKAGYADALMNRWQLLFDKKEFDAALRDIDLCNTEKSRACSLETLYALGRIDEIYKRIEMQAEFDDGNLRMAALSSFISEREKKNTAHEFCRNPQSFIHFSNISSHLEDASTFVTGVIEELNKEETIWEPNGKTTVKGFQTLKHINLFANPSGKMTQLKSIILNELDAYYLKFQNESCSFIKKWPSKKNLNGWYVILKKQGFQNSHIHTSGWLSGVIYLKVVPPLKKDEGAIEFSLNSKNYSDLKSPRLLHQPALGDIVFFPSSLHHRTIPFTTETDRIIVSFDLMPRDAKVAKH
jgi:tetratricopeptide (TPR) repeat protein